MYLPLVRQPSAPRLVFGLGPTASNAKVAALASQAPLGLLTTWYYVTLISFDKIARPTL